jgi:tetraacyldisaccharide-1-P 4'-kinase
VRSSLSVLAVDAELPWGAGDLPPAGDLRAPRSALLAHADHVVSVDATPPGIEDLAASLAGSRVGLFTALGRPERLVRALARARITSLHVARAADHGPISRRLEREIRSAEVDIWLATAKCAVHLEAMRLPARLAILDGSLILPPALTSALSGLRVGASGAAGGPWCGEPAGVA